MEQSFILLKGARQSLAKVRGWQDTHHLAATLLVDTSQAVPSMYNGTTTPTTYVLDRAGRVTFSQTGPLSYDDFQRHISSVMWRAASYRPIVLS